MIVKQKKNLWGIVDKNSGELVFKTFHKSTTLRGMLYTSKVTALRALTHSPKEIKETCKIARINLRIMGE